MAAPEFFAELPDGYVLRPAPKIARSTRNASWSQSQDIQWGGMLRDLYLGGGYGWQHWGSGHITSGITKALAARGCIEVAKHPRQPLLFRLTPEGHRIAMSFLEERGDEREAPADAPTSYKLIPRPAPVLSPEDAHLLAVLQDEDRAITESLARMAQYEADGEIYDREAPARLRRRQGEIRPEIARLTGRAA